MTLVRTLNVRPMAFSWGGTRGGCALPNRRYLLLILVSLLSCGLSCASQRHTPPHTSQLTSATPTRMAQVTDGWPIKGISFVSWTDEGYLDPSALASLDQVVALNAQWVAIVPHWFMENQAANEILPDLDRYAATDESVRHIISQARARGLKVMLKPHVDSLDSIWRGRIAPSDPRAWLESYRRFMLHYAALAAETGAEMLSISTELQSMTGPPYTDHWRSLAAEVRGIYGGLLTAAANWGPVGEGECYRVEWWDAVDYIGVNAYFPLTDDPDPTVEAAKAGWLSYTDSHGRTNHWVDDLRALAGRFGKQVILTEVGFNSVTNPGAEWDAQAGFASVGQTNCVEATFQVFDREPWVAGAFWWEWRDNLYQGRSPDGTMVLNATPAAQTIARWYGPRAGTYDAERELSEWEAVERCTKLWLSPDILHGDRRALGAWAEGLTKETPGYVRIAPPANLVPGSTITAHVYVGTISTPLYARLYVQGMGWTWAEVSPRATLSSRSWTQIQVAGPADTTDPLRYLGIEFTAEAPGFTGPVYVGTITFEPPPAR